MAIDDLSEEEGAPSSPPWRRERPDRRGPIVIDADAFGADIVRIPASARAGHPRPTGLQVASLRCPGRMKPRASDRYAGRDSVAFSPWSSLTSTDMALRVSSNTSSQSGGASPSYASSTASANWPVS